MKLCIYGMDWLHSSSVLCMCMSDIVGVFQSDAVCVQYVGLHIHPHLFAQSEKSWSWVLSCCCVVCDGGLGVEGGVLLLPLLLWSAALARSSRNLSNSAELQRLQRVTGVSV